MNLIDDEKLLKLAEAEILKKAKQAAARYSVAGVSGWQPCPKPNKVFLANTILQTMASNKLHSRKLKGKGEKKSKHTDRKLLQKSNKTDTSKNFAYQKQKKNNEKHRHSKKKIGTFLSKKSKDRHSEKKNK